VGAGELTPQGTEIPSQIYLPPSVHGFPFVHGIFNPFPHTVVFVLPYVAQWQVERQCGVKRISFGGIKGGNGTARFPGIIQAEYIGGCIE
jgi:hypothetical protein